MTMARLGGLLGYGVLGAGLFQFVWMALVQAGVLPWVWEDAWAAAGMGFVAGCCIRFRGPWPDSARRASPPAPAQDAQSFRAVLKHLPVGVAEIDLTGRFLYNNAAGVKVTGYAENELLGRTVFDLQPDEERADSLREYLAYLIRERPNPEVWKGVATARDGRVIDIEAHWDYRRDSQGAVTGFVVALSDVTRRTQAEKRLAASETSYRRMVESMQEALCVLTPAGEFLFANTMAAVRLPGAQGPEDVAGRRIGEFLPPEQAGELLALCAEVVRTRMPRTWEEELVVPEGSVWYRNSLIPVRYGPDESPCILSTSLDVTDLKHTERSLLEALERLSFHVENTPLGVIEWDRGRNIATWSRSAEDVFGWSADEIMGRNWGDFRFVHEDDAERVEALIGDLIDGGASSNVIANRNYRKDGSVIHCRWYNSPLRDAGGRVISILSQVADVTEMENAVRTMEAAKVAAEEANRSKSRFLANMSHELRTPLNGIIGMHQLLAGTDLDEEQARYVERAVQSARGLTDLLGDVLDLSRIEAGRLDLAEESFDVREVLERVESLFGPSIEHKGLCLTMAVDEDIPHRLHGDRARLQQILNNLVGNAVKFTESGGVAVEAWALRTCGGPRVLFTVSDTGIGMRDEVIDSLFDAFAQGSHEYSRKCQGAGLGLSIVRSLVSLMRGVLCVDTAEGEGARFFLSLPLIRDGAGVGAEASECAPPVPERTAEAGSVLLVEDDRISRFALGELLSKSGYDVRTARDGREALEELRREPVDLVLMDIQMPVMDGVRATRAIRRGEAGARAADVPILALTAYAMSGDRETFLREGMDGYVPKPVVRDVMLEEMRRALAARGR